MLQLLALAGVALFAVVALTSVAAVTPSVFLFRAEHRGSACTEFGTGR